MRFETVTYVPLNAKMVSLPDTQPPPPPVTEVVLVEVDVVLVVVDVVPSIAHPEGLQLLPLVSEHPVLLPVVQE